MKRGFVTCIVLACIMLSGTILRVSNLGQQSYWMDEGYTVNAVLSEMHNGTKNLSAVLDSEKTYFCPLYCAPTELIVRALGNHPASYRLLSVLFGIAMIVVVYIAANLFFGDNWTAIFAAFFTTYSYWQVAWSREARWYTELEVFFWLALMAYWIFLRKKKVIWLGVAIILTLLAVATHRIAYLLPVVMFIWAVVDGHLKKIQILYAAIGAAALLAVLEFVAGFHLITYALRDITLQNNFLLYAVFYAKTYWLFILLTIAGFVVATNERRRIYALLLTPLALYFFFLSFFTDVVQFRYLFHTLPALFLIGAASMLDIGAKIHNSLFKKAFILAVIVVFFLSGEAVLASRGFYELETVTPPSPPVQTDAYYPYTPQPNWNKAYAYVQAVKKPDDIVISSNPVFTKIFLNEPGYWIQYDYLGGNNRDEYNVTSDHELYVNAQVIHDVQGLKELASSTHGYIVLDYMATDKRIPQDTVDYIFKNLEPVFYDQHNLTSQIWVYRF